MSHPKAFNFYQRIALGILSEVPITLHLEEGLGSLDFGSARSTSVPGLYLIVKSYPCILSNILWSLGGAAVRFFK